VEVHVLESVEGLDTLVVHVAQVDIAEREVREEGARPRQVEDQVPTHRHLDVEVLHAALRGVHEEALEVRLA
jgi:hypothetical protein